MVRFVRWAVAVVSVQTVVLAVLSWIMPGFTVGAADSVALAAVLFTVAQAAAWPVIYGVAGKLHPLLFPILSFGLAGLLIVLLTDLVSGLGFHGVHVESFWSGLRLALGLTIGNTLVGALFSLRDDTAYDWFVTRQLRRTYAHTSQSNTPGFLFFEIDGLAEPVFQRALQAGRMPTLKRWLDQGSHRITQWEPDLSSQTSSSQAGILLGNNTDIPAFRWYDKASGELMVTSRMGTARELEHRLSTGDGLLQHGASRWNVFSGGAPDSVCTYSTFGVRGRTGSGSGRYLAYFANPYTLPRAVALYLGDVIRERWQAWRQLYRDEHPRVHRSLRYAFVRAATTTVMQEAGLFMLVADIYRSVPAVYATFFAYDEVAHHSGIDRIDALKVLGTLDRVIATLERATKTAPRPYNLVVLSDHGQSMGATFRQRYGLTLGQLVTSLVHPDARVTIDERVAEDWGHLNLALSEALHAGADRRSARLLRSALVGRTINGEVSLGPDHKQPARVNGETIEKSDVVVLASGNLGLISFPKWQERLTYEQIVERFPALIPGLITHEGIGFVLVNSSQEGGLAIGATGIHYLDDDHAVGDDPLTIYGPHAALHLRRTNSFANAPDLMVMSMYDAKTDEVAAFEELVGSHGGLGGLQTRPFVCHPVTLDPGAEPIVGAQDLHRVMMGWLRDAANAEVSNGR